MSVLQFTSANCRDCYKCVRACPVKAIEVKGHQAQIIERECILCGRCTIVCPQKSKQAVSELEGLKTSLRAGTPVVLSVAPSFCLYFGVAFPALREALLGLGFCDAAETAEGAYLVKSAYERLVRENPDGVLISSACTAVDRLIRTRWPALLPHLAAVETPVRAHADLLRQRYPEAKIAFASPCIAKLSEREDGAPIDFFLSFEELAGLLAEVSFPETAEDDPRRARIFPTDGGIIGSMYRQPGHDYLSVSGYDQCAAALEEVAAGALRGCFIEMSLCPGSCAGGPSFQRRGGRPLAGRVLLDRLAGPTPERDFDCAAAGPLTQDYPAAGLPVRARPTEEQLQSVLRKMGKHSPADELNCGMCGYPSCRDKAAAVLRGKAEPEMCLPYMRERAESLSNQIISVTPNAIVAVDGALRVHQINRAACQLFGLAPEDLVGQPVSRILDEFDFVELLSSGGEQKQKYAFLAEYNLYLEQIFRFDKSSGMIVCIMKDVTGERRRKNAVTQKKLQTAAMADDIADRQLRIVHEIASLLGETAAETKLAIHDLKETILLDDED